jgi:hypothetical protein
VPHGGITLGPEQGEVGADFTNVGAGAYIDPRRGEGGGGRVENGEAAQAGDLVHTYILYSVHRMGKREY